MCPLLPRTRFPQEPFISSCRARRGLLKFNNAYLYTFESRVRIYECFTIERSFISLDSVVNRMLKKYGLVL